MSFVQQRDAQFVCSRTPKVTPLENIAGNDTTHFPHVAVAILPVPIRRVLVFDAPAVPKLPGKTKAKAKARDKDEDVVGGTAKTSARIQTKSSGQEKTWRLQVQNALAITSTTIPN